MSKRTKKLSLLGALLGFLVAGMVMATHDFDLFELDGDAVDDPAVLGDDWNQIFCDEIDPTRTGSCSAVAATNALVSTFATDPVEDPADDIFAGAKDSLDIEAGAPQDWLWKVGEPNDKNDIEHAFAAIYEDPVTGDFILYFGLDKLSNNGDAAIGFWFLQNDVTQLGDGTTKPGDPFSAGHKVGDILVQADITSGGDIPRVDAYTWGPNLLDNDPVAPAQGELTKAIEGAECGSAAGDPFCAIMNTAADHPPNGAVAAPWPYLFKFSGGVAPSSVFPVATFFEAGLNLSLLFPDGIPCIQSLLAETRQSQSETAELEDKLITSFDLCNLTVTKEGPPLSKVGDDVTYTITIANDGALPLDKVSIVDDVLGDLTDGTNPLIDSSDCVASLNAGDSCTIVVTRTVQAGDPDPLVNTVTVEYSRAGTSVTASDSHEVNLFQPSITLAKSGDEISKVGDEVNYTIEVCNTSSADTPNLIKDSVTDTLIPGVDAVFGASLTSGACESHNFTRTVVPGDPDPLVNTATAHYHPDGFLNDIPASDSHSVNLFQPAIAVDKTGDTLSKVGDIVNYIITLSNNSSADTPAMNCTAEDSLLGQVFSGVLPLGNTVVNSSRVVLAGDPDPLVNTVTLTCSPQGFPNVLTASDSHEVNLFQPSYTLAKFCDKDPVTVGDTSRWKFTIANTSSADSPALNRVSVTDVLLGGDISASFPANLGVGQSVDILLDGPVTTAADIPTLTNNVSSLYQVAGFPNQIAANAAAECNVVPPAPATIIIEKLTIGGTGVFTYATTEDGLGTGDDLPDSFQLNTGVSNPNSVTFVNIPTLFLGSRVFTVDESVLEPGSTFVSLQCFDNFSGTPGSANSTVADDVATIRLEKGETVKCAYVNEFPTEGCTPGFWKNHTELWAALGFNPTDDFDTVFGVNLFIPDKTLQQAINLGGGGFNKLARHAVAGLLSAASPDVNYPFTVAEVIAKVQQAVASGNAEPFASELAAANDQFCPLN